MPFLLSRIIVGRMILRDLVLPSDCGVDYMEQLQNCLNELAKQYSDRVIWVLGHCDIPINYGAKKLASLGSTIRLLDKFSTIDVPLEACGHFFLTLSTLDEWLRTLAKRRARSGWVKHIPLTCLDCRETRSAR